MQIDETLKAHVYEYRITVGDIEFWAPYLRNDNYTQDPRVPRGLGKSTPEEIAESARYIKELFPDADGEEIRRKLIDGSLPDKDRNYKAIECSGFVFHVMDRTYRDILAKSLVSDLSVPKSHVLNGARNLEEWRQAYDLSDEEADRLPEDVPMDWVVTHFKRQPQNLCRVAGLVSDYSSIAVGSSELRPGDLIHMGLPDDPIPHVVIVLETADDSIVIAHSGRRDPADIGGVSIETLPRSQTGIDASAMRVPHVVIGYRRLKSLAAL